MANNIVSDFSLRTITNLNANKNNRWSHNSGNYWKSFFQLGSLFDEKYKIWKTNLDQKVIQLETTS